MPDPLLELQNLAFERDDRPLFEGLSANLLAGEIVQLTGPNGCGKTTLLHILSTLKSPSMGRIRWRGKDVQHNPDYLANIAFIGHQPGVKLGLSPRENLTWYRHLHHPHHSAADRNIDDALNAVGLKTRMDRPCSTFSAGQLRRVALASLYLRDAVLWLLDEPLTALDAKAIRELETLFGVHLSRGGMIMFSSHQALSLDQVRSVALPDYTINALH